MDDTAAELNDPPLLTVTLNVPLVEVVVFT
jgi:hypothetical protein